MKRFLVILAVCSAAFAARQRDWKDAEFVDVRSTSNNGGVAQIPLNGTVFSVPIVRTFVWYRFDTQDITYILWQPGNKKPLNVTLHGHAKIATEGNKAYVLDNSGKEIKLALFRSAVKLSGSPSSQPTTESNVTPSLLPGDRRVLPASVPSQSPEACNPAIESHISGDFDGWSSDKIYELDNGQIWKQSTYHYHYHYAYHPKVLIYSSVSGCHIRVDGDDDDGADVSRVK